MNQMRSHIYPAIVYTYLVLIGTSWGIDLSHGEIPFCQSSTMKITRVTDCDAAVRMIPSGIPEISFIRYENPATAINMELDHNGGRSLRLPAAFIAGSCVVTVEPVEKVPEINSQGYPWPQWQPTVQPPQKAATAMYFQVWPNVRAAAEAIIRKCIRPRTLNRHWKKAEGYLSTKSVLEGWEFQYEVTVKAALKEMPSSGRGPISWIAGYNIYESEEVPPAYRTAPFSTKVA